MRRTEYRLRASVDGWFAALDNLYERQREQTRKFPSVASDESVRRHQFGLQMNLFKEQREWVRIGEEIGFFPKESAKVLDRRYLLEQYSLWVDPNLTSTEGRYTKRLQDPEYFTRAYSVAVSGLTAAQLERIHLTHFASDAEWQLALVEIQVLRAMSVANPGELISGRPVDEYNLYWFLDWYEAPEEDETPSSWRNGGYWPGVDTAIRLDTLRDQFHSFEAEFAEALLASSGEDATARTEDSNIRVRRSRRFTEKELLAIASGQSQNLKLIRESIVRLLEGGGRDRVKR